MSGEDVWLLFALGFGLAMIGYVAVCLIYNRMQLPRSRCPGCGRWRRGVRYSCDYHVSFFECRKCGMTWTDIPP